MRMCPACGERLERWEVRCTRCVVSTALPDSRSILVTGQALPYRLARSIGMAAGGALAGAAAFLTAFGILALLPIIFNGTLLPLLQAVVLLAGIFGALIGFSAIPVSIGEAQKNATFEVSNATIRFNDLNDPCGAEAKFSEREIDLASVCRVCVVQEGIARLFGYGTIEIFTDDGAQPAATFPGVTRPHLFKEKLELMLMHRDIKHHN
jgi:hypothetical protein